jgi:RNA polymerase sigma-70 factor (ECF subfamily)
VTPTDSELVTRARRGNQAACREIVGRYQRPVFNLIVRMVRDRTLAEDLSQDTFLKAFSRLDRYDPRYKLSNWLLKIAHNTVVDHFRQRKSRSETLPLEFLGRGDEPSAAELGDPAADDPLENLVRAEIAQKIECAMAALRPEYRQVVVLRYHEDLSHEEIARIMDLPVGTVKSHLHRARAQLAESLARISPAEGRRVAAKGPATGNASGS